MLNPEIYLRLAGVSLLALALLHMIFPRRFNWKAELAHLSLLNRQMFLVHAFFIALVVAMMGTLTLLFPETLLAPTPLGRLVAAGLTIFWTARLVIQWFVYDAALWRRQRFNTIMHVLFTFLWSYYAALFGWILWMQTRAT